MSAARDVLDRVSAALLAGDYGAASACYAPDAVAVTPDEGELVGRERIVDYFRRQAEPFPDGGYEPLSKHDAGDVAIDEGFLTGTHTAPLRLPSGDVVPATGRRIRVRTCDVAVVADGVIVRHRWYFDQLESLAQLGLLPGPVD